MEDTGTRARSHNLTLANRRNCTMTGVCDVQAFDEKKVLLSTEQGTLEITGTKLHVSRLSLEKGEADIEGQIDSLVYKNSSPAGKEESLLSRLFR